MARILALARDGLSKLGHHGEIGAMGVPREDLPHWDDIQILPAQMTRKPLLDDAAVFNQRDHWPAWCGNGGHRDLLWRGRDAARRAGRKQPVFLRAGFGPVWLVAGSCSQGAGVPFQRRPRGQDGHGWSPADFKRIADQVRERSGGIPIGFKLSANHIEDDIDFALEASADCIILDGRSGGTGAAPLIFRDHISVPTIPALARARKHLDGKTGREVTLVITGGLRVAEDFAKAIALGADAVSNSAMQAVGCIAARICNSNNCPVGVATQKPELRKRLDVQIGAEKLSRFFGASTELMQVLARACGHDSLSGFTQRDITTWKREMADLSGIRFAGV